MIERWVNVLGVGVVTDSVGSIAEIARRDMPPFEAPGAQAVEGEERLAGLAIRAVGQAVSMSATEKIDGERVGLIYVSAWGTIDATVAFLESMLEAGGKYASPRHFSRSVYSSVAAAVAIRFGIKGPCETLAFERAEAVPAALIAAWRLLAAKRCERVIVVWADQAAEIAAALARRAATELGKKEYDRYAAGLGEGAAAVALALEGEGLARIECTKAAGGAWGGKPFPADGAAAWVARMVKGEA